MDDNLVEPIYEVKEIGIDIRSIPIRFKMTPSGLDVGDCWICVSHRQRRGYALVSRKGREYGVHRYVYELHHGKVPSTLVLLHRCDNPSCINPSHLVPGTQRENVQDMHRKGRGKVPWLK